MTQLFVFFAAQFGLAYVVSSSSLSYPFRVWFASRGRLAVVTQLLECPACFGFWSGAFSAGFGLVAPMHSSPVASALLFGFATAGVNMAAALVTRLIPAPGDSIARVADSLEVISAYFDMGEALPPHSVEAQQAALMQMAQQGKTTDHVHPGTENLAEFAHRDAAQDDAAEDEATL